MLSIVVVIGYKPVRCAKRHQHCSAGFLSTDRHTDRLADKLLWRKKNNQAAVRKNKIKTVLSWLLVKFIFTWVIKCAFFALFLNTIKWQVYWSNRLCDVNQCLGKIHFGQKISPLTLGQGHDQICYSGQPDNITIISSLKSIV